jgi:hypothetical protein
MEPIVAFLAGLVVGIVIGIAIQRTRSATVPGIAATSPQTGSLPVAALPPARPGATRVATSSVRFEGDTLTVDVNGRSYQRLADVPLADRDLLVKELNLLLDEKIPGPMRQRVQDFLGADVDKP